MSARYRMSYTVTPGPGKRAEERADGEGLTDYLVVVSVLGHPGGPGGMSAQVMPVGPEGGEAMHPAIAHLIATALLAGFPREHPLAASIQQALAALRGPFAR